MPKVTKGLKMYFFRVMIALDQLVNTVFNGNPDETISSRWGKGAMRECKFCTFMCTILNLIDPNHCEKSIEWDEHNGTWGGSK